MPSCNCKSACSGARCACATSGAMCDAGCSCSATVCHNRVSGCGVLCTMACLLRALKVCVRVRVCGLVVAWMCAVVFQCFCVCSVPISASVYVRARLLAGAVMHVMSVCVYWRGVCGFSDGASAMGLGSFEQVSWWWWWRRWGRWRWGCRRRQGPRKAVGRP